MQNYKAVQKAVKFARKKWNRHLCSVSLIPPSTWYSRIIRESLEIFFPQKISSLKIAGSIYNSVASVKLL